MLNETEQGSISLIADFSGDFEALCNIEVQGRLPILPLRNMVLFPGIVAPITTSRESSRLLIEKARLSNSFFGVVCQRDEAVENPERQDLFDTGIIARVVRVIELPIGGKTIVIQAHGRFRLGKITRKSPYLRAEVQQLPELLPAEDDREFLALADSCKDQTLALLKATPGTAPQAMFTLRNISHPNFLINFICLSIPLDIAEKQGLLEINEQQERALKLLALLNRETQFAHLKQSIQAKTQEDLEEQQKVYFLQQQIKNIRSELGETSDDDIAALRQRAEDSEMPQPIKALFAKETQKLERMAPQSPDYAVQENYLRTLVELPWGKRTTDNLNLKNAARVLNRDHYGLEKVKERILEYLATLHFRTAKKSPILCLYGPPGVGKTSLGRSIAEALGRKYVRISLGGLHDEAEIRGHRRTYIGAMPGRIIKSLIKAETSNPVFILDEIDKVTRSQHEGNPLSALLEVLDPEQNAAFHDNFVDIDYDLSDVFFIATANSISDLPLPLLDRMELINVEGYLAEEKREIARKHLIPKNQKQLDFGEERTVNFKPAAIDYIIEKYTRESGVRQLEGQIEKIFRKVAYEVAAHDNTELLQEAIEPHQVETLLGKPVYSRDLYQGNKYAGVVTGLAWTSVGGEILFIETSLSRSKAPKLTITGNLGDVMKESCLLALEYIKAHADLLSLNYRIFENWAVHVHVPEGATPKDGPSAGITIATSIASALTQRKVRAGVAMTGEITLRGRVLPVGGIKEKILAAKRAGITDILVSTENEKDVREIPEKYLRGVHFHFVSDVKDVLGFALLPEKVDNATCLDIPEEAAVQ